MSTLVRDTPSTQIWESNVADAFTGLMPAPLDERAPRGALVGGRLGGISAFEISGTAQAAVRRRTRGRTADDAWKAYLPLSGRGAIESSDGPYAFSPGRLIVYDVSRVDRIVNATSFRGLVLVIPRHAAATPGIRPGIWSSQRPGGRLLIEFIAEACRSRHDATSAAYLGDAAVSLLAAAISGTEGVDTADIDTLRRRSIAYIERHLSDAMLTPDGVARALGISRRTLDRLFESDEHGVAGSIRMLRLEALRQELIEPAHASETIRQIAARWCFFDASHLAHSFRGAFGVSANDYRMTHLGEG